MVCQGWGSGMLMGKTASATRIANDPASGIRSNRLRNFWDRRFLNDLNGFIGFAASVLRGPVNAGDFWPISHFWPKLYAFISPLLN